MYKVLKVGRTNLYDIFKGDGWKNWTRVYYDGTRFSHEAGGQQAIDSDVILPISRYQQLVFIREIQRYEEQRKLKK